MPPVHSPAAAAEHLAGIAHPDRLVALRAVADRLDTDRARILRLLTEVTTHRAAEYEIEAARATLAGAGTEVDTYRPAPVARLAAFMPSNVLLYSYVLYLLVPALFVERIRFRPASQVRGPMLALHELLAPVHGLPVTAMPVSQRAFLRDAVAPADLVVFTGSYQNAEQIRPQLRPEQLFVFLGGGINPFVVAPGADLATATRDAATIRLWNSGQDCLAPDLFLVNQADLDEFLARLVDRLAGLRYGPAADPAADYGPMVYDEALERAALYLFRNQPHIVHGGTVDFGSRRIEPTVVLGAEPTGKLGRTEVFAPIFNVVGYQHEDTLIQTLNSGVFAERALGASVYGRAPRLVAALAERHLVTVDETLLAADDGNAPFGGRGPMANYLAHAGRLHAEPVLLSKAVAEHPPAAGGAA